MVCKSFFPACVVCWCMRGDLNVSGDEVLAISDGLELQWPCGLGMTSLSSFIRHNFHVLWSGWMWEISREFVELLWFVWLWYGKCLAIENCMYLYVLCFVVVMFVQLLIWSCSVVIVWSTWVHACMLMWRFSLTTLKHFLNLGSFFWVIGAFERINVQEFRDGCKNRGKGLDEVWLCESILSGWAKAILGSVPCRGFVFNLFATFCIYGAIGISILCCVCVQHRSTQFSAVRHVIPCFQNPLKNSRVIESPVIVENTESFVAAVPMSPPARQPPMGSRAHEYGAAFCHKVSL